MTKKIVFSVFSLHFPRFITLKSPLFSIWLGCDTVVMQKGRRGVLKLTGLRKFCGQIFFHANAFMCLFWGQLNYNHIDRSLQTLPNNCSTCYNYISTAFTKAGTEALKTPFEFLMNNFIESSQFLEYNN